ncbi:uncharacterized protein LOC134235538 [Saccostrea cucullata]|uniref:uncharacterized protein LOC134235538 n=1 Tax=Saccostrea cuccullata TaxID=36930 RepID=UPI002ED2A78C
MNHFKYDLFHTNFRNSFVKKRYKVYHCIQTFMCRTLPCALLTVAEMKVKIRMRICAGMLRYRDACVATEETDQGPRVESSPLDSADELNILMLSQFLLPLLLHKMTQTQDEAKFSSIEANWYVQDEDGSQKKLDPDENENLQLVETFDWKELGESVVHEYYITRLKNGGVNVE